jgi:hypothetical protein
VTDDAGANATSAGDEGEDEDDSPSLGQRVRRRLGLPESIGEQIRLRLGLSPRQWFVLGTVLLLVPFPLFWLLHVYLDVPQSTVLAMIAVYSVVAFWFGFQEPQ